MSLSHSITLKLVVPITCLVGQWLNEVIVVDAHQQSHMVTDTEARASSPQPPMVRLESEDAAARCWGPWLRQHLPYFDDS